MANSKRKCKCCKEYKKADSGKKTPVGWFCCIDHALIFANEAQEKARERKIKKARQLEVEETKSNIKALLEFNRKDLRWQHKQTQPVFNKMRVLEEKKWFIDRGIEPSCISCGKTNMDFCAGHFKSVGAQSRLRYDRKNVYLQCNRYCNMALSGNIEGNKNTIGYKEGLKNRFGDEEGQSIIDYRESNHESKKLTCEEIEKMRSTFNKRIRELQLFIFNVLV